MNDWLFNIEKRSSYEMKKKTTGLQYLHFSKLFGNERRERKAESERKQQS